MAAECEEFLAFHLLTSKRAISLSDIDEDVRHVDRYEGVFFLVGDKKQSVSSMHVSSEERRCNDKIVAFWSEGPTYANYLLSIFESAWTHGQKALMLKERISGLPKEGPSQASQASQA